MAVRRSDRDDLVGACVASLCGILITGVCGCAALLVQLDPSPVATCWAIDRWAVNTLIPNTLTITAILYDAKCVQACAQVCTVRVRI